MEQDDKKNRRHAHGSGHIFSGLILLAAGGLLLLSRMGAPLPGWLFSWHSLLIAIGLFIGFRSNFRNPGWVIMVNRWFFFTRRCNAWLQSPQLYPAFHSY